MSDLIINDGEGEAVFHFSPGSAPGGDRLVVHGFQWDALKSADDQAQTLYDAFEAHLLPQTASNVQLQEVSVRINNAGTILEGFAPGVAVGPAVGDAATPAVAYLLRKRTGLAGRAHRGRMYLVGVTETNVAPTGAVLASKISALNVACAGYLAELVTQSSNMLLLHGVPLAGPPAPPSDEVLTLTCEPFVATQRRRQR